MTKILKWRDRRSLELLKKDVETIRRALEKLPNIRQDRVEEIKRLIIEGAYNIRGRDVAEKISCSGLLGIFFDPDQVSGL